MPGHEVGGMKPLRCRLQAELGLRHRPGVPVLSSHSRDAQTFREGVAGGAQLNLAYLCIVAILQPTRVN